MSDRIYAVPSGHRYRYDPTHPLAHPTRGTVYEGRRVFLASHGEGPHHCQRCGVELHWPDLQVWRLNGWPGDDRPENLAPRCVRCARMRHPSRVTARKLTYRGETLTVAQWGRRIGVSASALHNRLARGWGVSSALSIPSRDGPPTPAQARHDPFREGRGVVDDFGETTGDRAPSATRKNVELGFEKPKRGDLDG